MSMLFLVACGGGGTGDGNGGNDQPDAKVFLDAPPIVPATIMISGTASERNISGSAPVAGLTISVHKVADEGSMLGTTTTDAQGMYTLAIMSEGAPVDAFIKASKTGYVDLYLYPPTPFIANFTEGSINMLTQSNFDFLSTLAQGNQQAGNGLIGLLVRDANGAPVAGATVASTPAAMTYRYNGSNGLPSSSATATDADGIAYMFNVPAGAVTISASKAGTTFKAHMVKARADKFTTTSIAE